MKKILLSSAAIVAFAGAAAAEVTFSGSATLGYTTVETAGVTVDGVYTDADLDIAFEQELNNGWTAGASFSVELINDNAGGNDLASDTDFTIYIESDMGGLYYGDYDSAAEQLFSGPEDLETGISDYDDDNNLVAKVKVGGFEVAASASVDAAGATSNTSVGAAGEFGSVTASLGYDETADATAIAVGTSFAGADVTVGYADVAGADNFGIEVGYPVGPVALNVWYANNDDIDTVGLKAVYENGPISVTGTLSSVDGADARGNLEGTYAVSEDLLIGAGYVDGEGAYLAAEYSLGGGATLLASYADDEDDTVTGEDIGDAYDDNFELKEGFTVELSLDF